MKSNPNFFLVIEGLDGSGKTEMARRLTQAFKLANNENIVRLTFEPHDPSCAGLFIRQVLTRRIETNPLTLALAFTANRLDHCERVIKPFLEEGRNKVLICDRYYLSSIVYQTNEELSVEELINLNRNALKPDLTLFLNASNKTCAERMKRRDEEKELFEKNLAVVRNKYLEAIEFLKKQGENIVEIDANGSQDEVLNNIIVGLNNNSPEWLMTQPVLPLNYYPEIINITESNMPTLLTEAQNIIRKIMPFQIVGANDMNVLLNRVSDETQKMILDKSSDEVGYLFLDYLQINKFSIREKFAWSDIDAFYLDSQLPLAIPVRGIVILGNEIQRELVIQKKIANHNFESLSFIFLFLPSIRQKENFFESEFLITVNQRTFAPSIKRFYKDDLVSALILQIIKLIQTEYHETISALPEIRKELFEFCNARNLIN